MFDQYINVSNFDALSLLHVIAVKVRANVQNVLFVSNRTCVKNAFGIFANVKRTCKHLNDA